MGLASSIYPYIVLLTTSTTFFFFNFALKSSPSVSLQILTAQHNQYHQLELKNTSKLSIIETQAQAYQTLQQNLISQNKPETALVVSERGRNRSWVELLLSRDSPPKKVAINFPNIQKIKEIASQQNATLVQYSIISDASKESELYIWVIQPNGQVAFRSVDLKSRNSSLQDLVTKTRKSLGVSSQKTTLDKSSKQTRNHKSLYEGSLQAEENSTKTLQQLYEILIKPIENLLPIEATANIVFIPQGELFLVPFAALQDKQGKYLIEKHTILTAPSIQVLDLTYQQKQRLVGIAKDILIVGNPTSPKILPKIGEPVRKLSPLPGAEREAIEISQILNTQPLIGDAATETAVLQKLPKAKIIHLATHALLEDFANQGTPGVVILASSSKDDGLLTASEIQHLRLNAELVVLSGDNTALGKISGDGVIGLSRSFIAAGVPNIIGSLWGLADKSTANLMIEFYRQLHSGSNVASALRQAMLQAMKENPNPKYWAAFTLIGTAK